MKTIEQEFIETIIAKVNAGWFWTNLIRMALTKGLEVGLKTLKTKHPIIQNEVLQLMLNYNKADGKGMIDEAADVLAAIVKRLFYPKLKR